MILQSSPERSGALEHPPGGYRRPIRPEPADVRRAGDRYARLRDRRLADTLAAEDAAEDHENLSPHERLTCHFHCRWAYECIGSPLHIIIVTGHRWCPNCEAEAMVAVDELTGSVSVNCIHCRQAPETSANRQIVRTCRASLAAALEQRRAHQNAEAAAV